MNLKKASMKMLVGAALVCATLSFNRNVFAQQPAPAPLLREAYASLEVADHDYKGHRVLAMKHVEMAAKLLGVDIHGGGKGHEKQSESDAQLKAAQNLLNQALPGLSGKPLAQVNKAIAEINMALSIK